MPISSLPDALEATYAAIRARLPDALKSPKVGIVCGSGLSTLAESLRDVQYIPYADLQGFGKSTGKAHIAYS